MHHLLSSAGLLASEGAETRLLLHTPSLSAVNAGWLHVGRCRKTLEAQGHLPLWHLVGCYLLGAEACAGWSMHEHVWHWCTVPSQGETVAKLQACTGSYVVQ